MGYSRKKVTDGATISVEYRITLENGSPISGTTGFKHLTFTQGEHRLPPFVERELYGLKSRDTKVINIPPEVAYGPVKENLIKEAQPDVVPKNSRRVNATVVFRSESGELQEAKVCEVCPDKIVLDFNHPLAGKTLKAEIKIIAVK